MHRTIAIAILFLNIVILSSGSLIITLAEELQSTIEFSYSPHFDERPQGLAIDTIILHATERNSLDIVKRIFAHPAYKVSAHYTIDRDGTTVQHVRENKRAWHAGTSKTMDGRENVNDFSIGIELVNLNDGKDPYPPEQISALRSLLAQIKTRHPISAILSHAEVALPPGRKSDPQGFKFKWLE